jgi:hypothetical protein
MRKCEWGSFWLFLIMGTLALVANENTKDFYSFVFAWILLVLPLSLLMAWMNRQT